MPSSKKRRLTEDEKVRALNMLKDGVTPRVVANKFNVTKPSLLKSVELWNTDIKESPAGDKYFIKNGVLHLSIDRELK